MSDPTFSDIDFKNKTALVWNTLKSELNLIGGRYPSTIHGWMKCTKLYKKCTVLSALDFKTDSTKSQCANPQSCLQFSHTAQLGPDFTPYYHIYKCNIIFFKFILGQPHVQISIVSDRPTDSPLVWLVFSVIRFVPISRCPMTEFARVFMTIPINRVGEVKKWTSDQWLGCR